MTIDDRTRGDSSAIGKMNEWKWTEERKLKSKAKEGHKLIYTVELCKAS